MDNFNSTWGGERWTGEHSASEATRRKLREEISDSGGVKGSALTDAPGGPVWSDRKMRQHPSSSSHGGRSESSPNEWIGKDPSQIYSSSKAASPQNLKTAESTNFWEQWTGEGSTPESYHQRISDSSSRAGDTPESFSRRNNERGGSRAIGSSKGLSSSSTRKESNDSSGSCNIWEKLTGDTCFHSESTERQRLVSGNADTVQSMSLPKDTDRGAHSKKDLWEKLTSESPTHSSRVHSAAGFGETPSRHRGRRHSSSGSSNKIHSSNAALENNRMYDRWNGDPTLGSTSRSSDNSYGGPWETYSMSANNLQSFPVPKYEMWQQTARAHTLKDGSNKTSRGTDISLHSTERGAGYSLHRTKRKGGEYLQPDFAKKVKAESSPTFWSESIHREFIEAIYKIGLKHSSPSVIMEQMADTHEALTNERVKSHLQKYRNNSEKSKQEFLTEYDGWMEKAMSLGSTEGSSPKLLPPLSITDMLETTKLVGGEAVAFLTYSTMADERNEPTSEGRQSDMSRSVRSGTARVVDLLTAKMLTGATIPFPELSEEELSSPVGVCINQVVTLFHSMVHLIMSNRERERSKKIVEKSNRLEDMASDGKLQSDGNIPRPMSTVKEDERKHRESDVYGSLDPDQLDQSPPEGSSLARGSSKASNSGRHTAPPVAFKFFDRNP